MPPLGGILLRDLLFLARFFAILVCNATAGLASGLARGLAFAATAVLCALAKVTRLDGFDMLHIGFLRGVQNFIGNIISLPPPKVNSSRKISLTNQGKNCYNKGKKSFGGLLWAILEFTSTW